MSGHTKWADLNHKSTPEQLAHARARVELQDGITTIFTVQPAARVPVDGDAGPLLDRVLDALEQDENAIAPACGYDYDTQTIGCTFQVELDDRSAGLPGATEEARRIFDSALHIAGAFFATSPVAVVEGDDPDRSPEPPRSAQCA